MSKVSVIIPTYNRADKITASIQSVLDQTYEDFELIVIDDASSDDTESVVNGIGDDRIRYHRMSENGGAARARNAGAELSGCEYIAFHDSDDKWLPDKLKCQMEYMEHHPDAGLVYGKIRFIAGEEVFVLPDEETKGDLEGYIYPWLLARNTIGTPAMLMKKKCFEEAGRFDAGLRCLEDWEFILRFAKLYKIGYIDEVLVDSYDSAGSVSWNMGAAFYEARCKMIAMHKADMMKYGIFDRMVMDIFEKAGKAGLLPQVQQMLMKLLQYYGS